MKPIGQHKRNERFMLKSPRAQSFVLRSYTNWLVGNWLLFQTEVNSSIQVLSRQMYNEKRYSRYSAERNEFNHDRVSWNHSNKLPPNNGYFKSIL